MEFLIRTATLADYPAMKQMIPLLEPAEQHPLRDPKDFYVNDYGTLEKCLAKSDGFKGFAIIALYDDVPVGMALVQMQGESMSKRYSAHLEAIIVKPEAEGKGLASMMLNIVENRAKVDKADMITLHVHSSNSKAQEIYENRGYHDEYHRCTKWL